MPRPNGCARLYAKGEQGKLLRIGVKTKGCSGMSYDMSWVDEPAAGRRGGQATRI